MEDNPLGLKMSYRSVNFSFYRDKTGKMDESIRITEAS